MIEGSRLSHKELKIWQRNRALGGPGTVHVILLPIWQPADKFFFFFFW